MPSASGEFTVLGAGIAGLATSLALAQRGGSVTILEQADAIRDVGAGLQISPNGARVLRALGLGDALDAAAMQAREVALLDGLSGSIVMSLDLARHPGSYLFVHRADLVAMLLKAAQAAGVALQLLQQIDTVDLSGDKPRLITVQGAARVCQTLIGTDGLSSRVRTALNGPEVAQFTQQVAWRALIPAEPDAPQRVEVHMAPGRHLVSYPLRHGTLRNIVAVEERPTWAEESWTVPGHATDLRLAFEDFCPRARAWLAQVDEVHLWGLFRHPVARHWHGGGAVLAGDAAHPMLPFLAQGANMALEDAWTLAASLDRHATTDAAFAEYQRVRRDRSARVVAASARNARAYHLAPPLRGIAHRALRTLGAVAPGLALGRFGWIHDFDATRAVYGAD